MGRRNGFFLHASGTKQAFYQYRKAIEHGDGSIISSSVQRLAKTPGAAMAEDGKTTSAEHLKGSVKEALGKLTGDARIEVEGRHQKKDADAPRAGSSKPTGSERS